MTSILWQEKLRVEEKYDLIVCGGGVAGAAAALSGRRHGLRRRRSAWRLKW